MPKPDRYVVVVLETESDFPGVTHVHGPYRHSMAETIAASLCHALKLTRGEHVQVSMLYDGEEENAC